MLIVVLYLSSLLGPGGGIPSPIGQQVHANPSGITGTDPRPCDWNGKHCPVYA
jgi:hypothetical protein